MPKLSHLGLLLCGIGLCVVGTLTLLYRPAELDRGAPILPPPQPRELTAADLPQGAQAIAAEGEKLVARHKCNYCHVTDPSVTPEHPRENCQYCHQQQAKAVLEHLAPPLASIAARRPGAWLRRYLRYPYAVRANALSRMPDLNLADFEVEVAARYLEQLSVSHLAALNSTGPLREAEPDEQKLEKGRQLMAKFACTSCHDVGEQKAEYRQNPAILQVTPKAINAPNLGETWQRVRPGWLFKAIRHPPDVMPWSGMPGNNAMTDQDAELLAWYVMNCVPSPKPTVSLSEVREIFNARCTACHYGPRPNPPMTANPDGGAGWLAVWGPKPRKLDLFGADAVETFAALRKGSLDDLGKPRAVVVPYAINSPLLAHLRGDKWPRMPFGQSPLPEEEYRKIESWILSGAKGPIKEGGIEVSPPIEFDGK